MPIYLADIMEGQIIRRISGSDKVRAHLNNLGFTTGEEIMLINRINDSVIVKIKGVSLAISNELAKKIFV